MAEAQPSRRFPGLYRLPGRNERFIDVAGRQYSRRQAERFRGTPLPKPKPSATRTGISEGFRYKDVFLGGRAIHSTKQMYRFVEQSKAGCFYGDVLIGGDAKPTSRAGEEKFESAYYPAPPDVERDS